MESQRMDLVIEGGTVITPFGRSVSNLGVRDGKIAAIVESGHSLVAKERIDARGKFLIAGVIDPHFHPERTIWSGFDEVCKNQTQSPLLGGVTTLGAFCHRIKDPRDGAFKSYRDALEEHSFLDMFFHTAIMERGQLKLIEKFAEVGMTSFKFYMTGEGEGGQPKPELYPLTELYGVDEGTTFLAFEIIAKLGGSAIAMVHSETWKIVLALEKKLMEEGRTDAAAWPDSHPNFAEEDMMRRAGYFAIHHNCPLYLVHNSTRQAPQVLLELRAKGANVIGEACTHHLTFTREVYDKPEGMLFRYVPPIRTREDLEAIWRAIQAGHISCIASDHINIGRGQKYPIASSIWDAIGGAPGTGTVLPVMLSEGVNKGRISLEKLTEICSYNVARAFGLFPQKGVIAVGSDADLVLVDLHKEVTLKPEMLNLDFSLWDGWHFRGWPVLTMIRGEVVMRNGEVVGRPGKARYLSRLC